MMQNEKASISGPAMLDSGPIFGIPCGEVDEYKGCISYVFAHSTTYAKFSTARLYSPPAPAVLGSFLCTKLA